MDRVEPADVDVEHLRRIRHGVSSFLTRVAVEYRCDRGRLLDVAPQDHEGARPHFAGAVRVETLDLDPAAGASYTGDITRHNDALADEQYDYVVCTEVLEHTVQPFAAVAEIARILRPGGLLFLTVPFNFRIHGPLPDCWRFTEHGLRVLLEPQFEVLELEGEPTEDRPLMPVQYRLVARRRAREL